MLANILCLSSPALATSTLILRPDGVGSKTEIASRVPDGGEANWEDVDEEVADDATSYIFTTATSYEEDLYHLTINSIAGSINYIRVYFRAQSSWSNYAKTAIKTHGVIYNGSEQNVSNGGVWTNYYTQYNTNPYTSANWTWTELASTQAGVALKAAVGSPQCTQVWIEVTCTPITIPTATAMPTLSTSNMTELSSLDIIPTVKPPVIPSDTIVIASLEADPIWVILSPIQDLTGFDPIFFYTACIFLLGLIGFGFLYRFTHHLSMACIWPIICVGYGSTKIPFLWIFLIILILFAIGVGVNEARQPT